MTNSGAAAREEEEDVSLYIDLLIKPSTLVLPLNSLMGFSPCIM